MKINRGITAATLVAMGLLGAGWAGWLAQPRVEAQAAAGARKPATAVATVDITRVYRSLKERESVMADGKRRVEVLRQMKDQQDAEIEKLGQEWDTMRRMSSSGAEAVKKLESQLEQKAVEYRVKQETESLRAQMSTATAIERLYRKMLDTSGRVAEDNGYDLVLFDEPIPDFRRVPPQQMDAALGSREVLWARESLNLTDQVITRMNNEYAANAGGQ